VGYIMRHRYHLKFSDNSEFDRGWQPLHHTRAYSAHYANHKLARPHLDTYTATFESQVRLVKTSPDATPIPTTAIGEFYAGIIYHWRGQLGPVVSGVPIQGALDPFTHIYLRGWVNNEDKTCNTPATKTVNMAPAAVSAFSGPIGSSPVEGTTPFNLELTACSPDIVGIDYKLAPAGFQTTGHHPTVMEPTPWIQNHPNGKLANTGSATGVTVQILGDSDIPVVFNTQAMRVLTGFQPNKTTYTIPLKARYIKTANTVTPGSVRATMTVLYMYK